ncbi:hypothetical protein [Virgibacillus sp. YIM 98842]|uniref:hypothetical protein n=1 Tax=Virgibacillus sp. YIM 98842 TaxID=2663533 RepID=UPI001F08E370|nr:hypothetical protein [Virgibacillus sp. YIM 98842]
MNSNHNKMYQLCKEHMHSYVLAELVDGTKVDGIITGLDNEYVYMAVPLEHHEQHHTQANPFESSSGHRYGFPGYGPGFIPGPGYGYGYGFPPRRFRRLVLPLAALVTLAALPWY